MLRDWRQSRRFSQLELALAAGISTRHLSFVETGRSPPSRTMLMRLAERLEVPLRERNGLLLVNLGEWRAHLLTRLERQLVLERDEALGALREELLGFGGLDHPQTVEHLGAAVALA